MVNFFNRKESFVIVSGPSRGGKSQWAEKLLSEKKNVAYLATSDYRINDPIWQTRIKRHIKRRPPKWRVIEAQYDLISTLKTIGPEESILVDALGAFVARNLKVDSDTWIDISSSLIDVLLEMNQYRVLVIEETGWGVVPPTKSGNIFRDRLGELSQTLSLHANENWLVVQGRAIDLQKNGISIL